MRFLLYIRYARLACLFALLGLTLPAHAQWAPRPTPFPTHPDWTADGLGLRGRQVVWLGAVDATESGTGQYARSVDGGQSWLTGAVTGLPTADYTSFAVQGADSTWTTAYVAGAAAQLLHTTNGGQTWTRALASAWAAPTGVANFVHFFDAAHGVVVGTTRAGTWEIYTTADGGQTWVPAATPPTGGASLITNGHLFSAVGRHLWFGAYRPGVAGVYVCHTADWGRTWTRTQPPTTGPARFPCPAFRDTLNGLFNDGSTLLRTTDGGQTWTPAQPAGFFFRSLVRAVPGTTAYVSSTHSTGLGVGTALSRNDGQTWTQLDNIDTGNLAFADALTGYRAGYQTPGHFLDAWAGILGTAEASAPASALRLYPNPTAGLVSLVPAAPLRSVCVRDLTGRCVLRVGGSPAQVPVALDLQALAAGTYLIETVDLTDHRQLARVVRQ